VESYRELDAKVQNEKKKEWGVVGKGKSREEERKKKKRGNKQLKRKRKAKRGRGNRQLKYEREYEGKRVRSVTIALSHRSSNL
jgi:hypothetical protein